jgi:hypothetical protein
MSYQVVQGGAKKRPGVVTAASSLLYFCAVVLVVTAVLSLLQIGRTVKITEEVMKGTPGGENAAAVTQISLILVGVVYVLLAVGFVVLGALVGKGKQPARIITWVVAGLGVLCLGCGLAGSGLTSSLQTTPESKVLAERLSQEIPAWQTTLSTVLTVLSTVALVAVIIMLALPAANDFFRKEQEVWVPPTTFPQDMTGIPPLPPPPGAQPPYPGQPGQPGQYPPSQPPTYPPGQ